MGTSDEAGRETASRGLVHAIEQLGYPEEFGMVLAGELRTEPAMRRMTAYLRQAGPRGPEEIADEMLAIVTDRDCWAEQKRSEYYNAKVTEFYNRPRNANDE